MPISAALGGAVGVLPAGSVIPYAGTTSPAGWLLCYGQAVSRTEYGALFTAIGTTYGSGDGSTTFTLPDLRGRVIAGVDNMGGSAASRLTSTTITGGGDAPGEVGGAQTHTLTSTEMPSHTHTTESAYNGGTSGSRLSNANAAGSGTSAFSYFATSSTGGGGAHNNVQPTMVMNYIIKAVAF